MHQKSHKITLFLLLSMSAMSAFAEEQTISATAGQLTGSFAVVNKYIYRGGVEMMMLRYRWVLNMHITRVLQ